MQVSVSKISAPARVQPIPWRFMLPMALLVILLLPDTHTLVLSTLANAFWQVSTYVAFTLAVFYYTQSKLVKNRRLASWLGSNAKWQVVFASFLGALPGCGGAIIVMTQFVQGRLSFGAVVAVLTATMGDAVFVLGAAEPFTATWIIGLSFVVGVLYGLLVDTVHRSGFMVPSLSKDRAIARHADHSNPPPECGKTSQGQFWKYAIIPSIGIAVCGSLQLDPEALLHLPTHSLTLVGALFALLSVCFWALESSEFKQATMEATARCDRPAPLGSAVEHPREGEIGDTTHTSINGLFTRVARDTNVVSCWVIGSFLAFELLMHWTSFDMASLFRHTPHLAVLMAIVIGLLPGCGPQIVLTSLYISGAVPLSAQLGNAISNDGDALFPAIALAPKAALVATLYTTIPAFIVGFGFQFFGG